MLQLPEDGFLLLRRFEGSRRLPLLQKFQNRLHDLHLRFCVAVAALGLLRRGIQSLLQAFHVGQHQLGLDRGRVAQGIDGAFDMGNIVILETAQHVQHRVDLPDVGQELVAQSLPLRRAAHQAGDVDELKLRRDDLRRACDTRQLRQPRVGDGDPPTFGSMVQNG